MAEKKIKVKLLGKDGNAFFILGTVSRELKRAGKKAEADEYLKEAMSGDYDHLLATTMKYVDIT